MGSVLSRLTRVALLLSALAVCACDPGAPTGNDGVLFFEPEFDGAIGEGLGVSVAIPRHVTLGQHPKSVDRVEQYDYDFDGTVLSFPETDGLTVLGSTLDDYGWHIDLRCTATPGVPARLDVAVRAGSEIRYEDSTMVLCDEGQLILPAVEYPHYVIGSTTNYVTATLQRDDLSSLSGRTLEDPSGTVRVIPGYADHDSIPGGFAFEAQKPGNGPLTAGTASLALPFDVVADDAWDYALTVRPDMGAGPYYEVQAKFRDGITEPVGQDCVIATQPPNTPTSYYGVGGCFAPVFDGHGTVCITVRQKTGCVDY